MHYRFGQRWIATLAQPGTQQLEQKEAEGKDPFQKTLNQKHPTFLWPPMHFVVCFTSHSSRQQIWTKRKCRPSAFRHRVLKNERQQCCAKWTYCERASFEGKPLIDAHIR